MKTILEGLKKFFRRSKYKKRDRMIESLKLMEDLYANKENEPIPLTTASHFANHVMEFDPLYTVLRISTLTQGFEYDLNKVAEHLLKDCIDAMKARIKSIK